MKELKTVEDFNAHLMFLEDSIKQYHENKPAYFRMMALHLWVLLCDTHQGKPLIERIDPTFRLHPQKGLTAKGEEEPPLWKAHRSLGPDHLLLPGVIQGNGTGKFKVNLLFDETKKRIKVYKWLNQPFLSEKFTIRKFLNSVRHKMGAHSDPDYDELLRWSKSFRITDKPSLDLATVGLREYIFRQIHVNVRKESLSY